MFKPGSGRLGNEVSPGVFYGSDASKVAHRPRQLLRLLNEIRDLASESTSSGRYLYLMISYAQSALELDHRGIVFAESSLCCVFLEH